MQVVPLQDAYLCYLLRETLSKPYIRHLAHNHLGPFPCWVHTYEGEVGSFLHELIKWHISIFQDIESRTLHLNLQFRKGKDTRRFTVTDVYRDIPLLEDFSREVVFQKFHVYILNPSTFPTDKEYTTHTSSLSLEETLSKFDRCHSGRVNRPEEKALVMEFTSEEFNKKP